MSASAFCHRRCRLNGTVSLGCAELGKKAERAGSIRRHLASAVPKGLKLTTCDRILATRVLLHHWCTLSLPAEVRVRATAKTTRFARAVDKWCQLASCRSMLVAPETKPDVLMPTVVEVMGELLKRHNQIIPLQVLLTLEIVAPDAVEAWRSGGLPYLERGLIAGLARVARVLRLVHEHAHALGLTPVPGKYLRRGKGPNRRLRFSKRGDPESERLYASHFVRPRALGDAPTHASRV